MWWDAFLYYHFKAHKKNESKIITYLSNNKSSEFSSKYNKLNIILFYFVCVVSVYTYIYISHCMTLTVCYRSSHIYL